MHAFLVLPFDRHRAGLAVDDHHVLRRHRLARGGVKQHVADFGHLFAVFLAEAHDDGVFVAGVAEHRGLGAGDVGANGVSDTGDRQAQQGGLVAVNAHGQFRTAFFTLQAGVGHAGRGVEHGLEVLGNSLGLLEVVSENLN